MTTATQDRANVVRAVRVLQLLALLAIVGALASCGGGQPTAPTQEPGPQAATGPVQVPLPAHLYGAFVASADVPEAAAHAGNVVLVVPSYADRAADVTAALRATGKVAILSAHHVFGGPQAQWEQGWAQTKAWAAGMPVAAVLVVDEPLHGGIPAGVRDAAIARVRADGYTTMTTEGVDRAIAAPRPPVDVYGVTCYWWPGPGSWSYDRCAAAYGDRPQWDLVIGQAWDDRGFEVKTATVRAWAALGRTRRGTIFWVWRWAGQRGIADHDGYLRAYDEGGR